MMGVYGVPRGWNIEGPRLLQQDEVHVYAYVNGQMIGMLDCELRSGGVQLRMAYVSPPWRGTKVLRDMLAALKGRYSEIAVVRAGRR
ncbi:hypothetical protein [Herbaspirillum robiniae]|uniref:N-acetyltransferase domain-containing protein n=1 Tax=Herbaspirillum robiniae TaxID=2014887 RepID=A0A2D0B5Q7_9BURK|nr:hypothetical protein [Herbaspirillum robiniae]NUU02904.1 hypothetical protein [Herbaspirillum robiniae]OWY29653.1 hypothetical protein CEJ42_07240 [Herbaspirillum robiniae]